MNLPQLYSQINPHFSNVFFSFGVLSIVFYLFYKMFENISDRIKNNNNNQGFFGKIFFSPINAITTVIKKISSSGDIHTRILNIASYMKYSSFLFFIISFIFFFISLTNIKENFSETISSINTITEKTNTEIIGFSNSIDGYIDSFYDKNRIVYNQKDSYLLCGVILCSKLTGDIYIYVGKEKILFVKNEKLVTPTEVLDGTYKCAYNDNIYYSLKNGKVSEIIYGNQDYPIVRINVTKSSFITGKKEYIMTPNNILSRAVI